MCSSDLRPDREGRYAFAGLPPTIYYVAVARDIDEGDINDVATLDRLSTRATTVQLLEGDHRTQDLRVRRAATGAAGPLAAHR